MSDSELIKQIIEGSHTAFDSLMERYYVPLYVFASRILNKDPIAEDVVQDVFVGLWVNRKKFDQVRSVRNYLYTTVRNSCFDIIKQSRRLEKYRGHNSVNEDGMTADYQAIELIRHLWDGVGVLPARVGEVIKLSLEGLRQDEIAEKMNIALPTVKILKAKGIKKLKNLFFGYFYF